MGQTTGMIDKVRAVAEASGGTMTARQIADVLGVRPSQVWGAITSSKRYGKTIPHVARGYNRWTVVRELTIPDMKLPTPVAKWLVAQIPAGGGLVDTLRGIVVDAYNDEVEESADAAFAAGVEAAKAALEALPRRPEKLGGQTYSYVRLEEAAAAIRALAPVKGDTE